MKTIFILMDSFNRRMLQSYNKDSKVETPNIDRFAEKSMVFENHWLGSAPCMPARRDLFTGRLNFLDRNWGPVEPFDTTLPQLLRSKGVFTHMVTDHFHYFEVGGENYCQMFDTWDFIRGQEWDPWISRVNMPEITEEHYGRMRPQHELNRSMIKAEEDFPTPKTFTAACKWLEDNKDADNYFLTVECFSPHEPFEASQEFLDMYKDDYDGPRFEWPTYGPVTEPPEAIEHINNLYAAGLSMADKYLGKLMDVLDKYSMWDDTMVVLTTDHGVMLGEHDMIAKSVMHLYNELAHLPLMVHLPGGARAGERVNALTQNIDMMPTILDYYGIDIPAAVQGQSLRGVLEGTSDKARDVALYGYFGKTVNMTDGHSTYFAAPARSDNYPCNIYCAMPTTFLYYMGMESTDTEAGSHLANYKISRRSFDDGEMGRFLKHTDFPVYKLPVAFAGEDDPKIKYLLESFAFNLDEDYEQNYPITDETVLTKLKEKLVSAMKDFQSPDEQFERLGL